MSRAHRLARRIDAGSVRVNAMPMGDFAVPVGGFKQSGLGPRARTRGHRGLYGDQVGRHAAMTARNGRE
ncbi:MAG: aldehyde dehydrogenase family protein [Sphingomonas sp.]